MHRRLLLISAAGRCTENTFLLILVKWAEVQLLLWAGYVHILSLKQQPVLIQRYIHGSSNIVVIINGIMATKFPSYICLIWLGTAVYFWGVTCFYLKGWHAPLYNLPHAFVLILRIRGDRKAFLKGYSSSSSNVLVQNVHLGWNLVTFILIKRVLLFPTTL